MSAFDVESFFQGQINEHCDLPHIGKQDAFALHNAACELVRALGTLRRLVPWFGCLEISRLVRGLASDPDTGDMAAAVVRMIANVPLLHTRARRTEYAVAE